MENVMAKAVPKKVKKKRSKRERRSRRGKGKKKTETESQSDDDDSSDEKDNGRSEEVKSKVCVPAPPLEKETLMGAVRNAPQQPPWFKPKLLEEERPELVAKCAISDLEAGMLDILDNYMKSKEDLHPGDLVIIEDNLDEESRDYSRYEVVVKYNEGRYSALYVVVKQTCTESEEAMGGLFAMKVGIRRNDNTILRFKRELAVLRELKKASAFYAPILVDSGRICDKCYIVMNLLDRNLEKLKEQLRGVFRPSSVYHLAGEALSGIEHLHAIGYIHRDIKPTNFCLGLGTLASRLFLVDYGDTVKNGKNIKYGIPDAYSLPYWALEEHKRGIAKPKIDVESWFYTFAELMYPELLTWKHCHVEAEIEEAKAKFWKEIPESVARCSPEIVEAAKIVQAATEKVDYCALKRIMEDGTKSSLKGTPLTLEWMKGKPEINPKSVDAAVEAIRREIDALESKTTKAHEATPASEGITGITSHFDDWKAIANNLMEKFRSRKRMVKVPSFMSQKSAESGGSAETASGNSTTQETSYTKPALEDRISPGKLIEMISLRSRRKKTKKLTEEKNIAANNLAAGAPPANQEKPVIGANENIANKEATSAENVSKKESIPALSMKSAETLFQKISIRAKKIRHLTQNTEKDKPQLEHPGTEGTATIKHSTTNIESAVAPIGDRVEENVTLPTTPSDEKKGSQDSTKIPTADKGSAECAKLAAHPLDDKKGTQESTKLLPCTLPDINVLLTKLNKYSHKKKVPATTSTGAENVAEGTTAPHVDNVATQKPFREGSTESIKERSIRSLKKKARCLWNKIPVKEDIIGRAAASYREIISRDKAALQNKQETR